MVAIPAEVRQLMDSPDYVHLSTPKTDGTPRNWVVWVGLGGEHVLIFMEVQRHEARSARRLALVDLRSPYRMASLQGRVVEVRPDEGCRFMDPIALKYTGSPFPSRSADRVCFVIAVEKARETALGFAHAPAGL
jgi:hypothetical protein